jgi:hypothetical protein
MAKASKKIKEKIKAAAKAGRIVCKKKDAPSINGLLSAIKSGKEPDWTLTSVSLESYWGKWERNDGGFEVRWNTKSAGCGGFTFYLKSGRLYCDNECLDKEFAKEVVCKLVNSSKFFNRFTKEEKELIEKIVCRFVDSARFINNFTKRERENDKI